MAMRYVLTVLALYSGLSAPAAAATLKGTAINGTVGRPAAGDEVVLVSLAGAATEIGHGKTDARGRFEFTVDGPPAPYLVRVVHQGVAYHAMAAAGVNPVEVVVYEAALALVGVTATLDVQRLQTARDKLQVIEEISVRNASDPPRTLVRAFEMQLPPEAQVVAGRVQTGDGQPLARTPLPSGRNGRHYFPFPLLPGDTRFAVAYLLPYKGEATIETKIEYPLEQFLVVLPKSMKFEAKTAGMFRPTPERPGSGVQEMAAVNPGELLAFRVSGTGTLANLAGGHQPFGDSRQARPESGTRTPAALPEPGGDDRWIVWGGLALVLASAAAGLLSHLRKQRLVPRRTLQRVRIH